MMKNSDSSDSLKREQVYDRFELAWRSPVAPNIESYLAEVNEGDRETTFKELLRIEKEIRKQRGQSIELRDYYIRFPSLKSTIDLVFCESDSDDPKAPPLISGFQLIDRLGAGGQGEVWLAIDSKMDRLVAIKILNPKSKDSQAAVARFRHEAEVTAKLEHPSVVPVYEIGEEVTSAGLPKSNSPCFVMKVYGDRRMHSAIAAFKSQNQGAGDGRLADALRDFDRSGSEANRDALMQSLSSMNLDEKQEGDLWLKSLVTSILQSDSEAGSLSKAIKKLHSKPWSETELRKLLSRFLRVCDAIGYAHSRGVVHCDLKPDNIMLGEFGETLVADWGLSREISRQEQTLVSHLNIIRLKTRLRLPNDDDSIAGTLRYMAPEQARGQSQLGPSSDIFSLGAVLYCILTGQAPIGSSPKSCSSTATTVAILSDKELYAKACAGEFLHPSAVEPNISKALAAVAVKAMSKTIDMRYETTLAFADDVQRWMNGDPVSAWPEPVTVRVRRWVKTHETSVVAIAACLCIAILSMSILFALASFQKSEIANALNREEQERKRAVAALGLAKTNAQTAKEQSQLALATLTSIVTELQRSLDNLPRGTTVRSRILSSSIPHLDKIATEFTSKADVDRITMIAIGELGDTLLEIGKLEGNPAPRDLQARSTKLDGSNVQVEIAPSDVAGRLYRTAFGIAEKLYANNMEDPLGQGDMAVSLERLGELALKLGQADEAIRLFERSYAIRQTMLQADTLDAKHVHNLIVVIGRLGQTFLDSGRLSEASDRFREAMTLCRSLEQANSPSEYLERDLAMSFDQLGSVQFRQGKTVDALAEYQEGLKLRLVTSNAQPDDERLLRNLSVSQLQVGLLLMQVGRNMEAHQNISEGLKIRKKLVDSDPENGRKQRDLSVAYNNLGSVLHVLGRDEEELESFNQALAIRRELAKADPNDQVKQRDLSVSLERVGTLLLDRGEFADAQSRFLEGEGIVFARSNSDPGNKEKLRELAVFQDRLGEVSRKLKKSEEAFAYQEKAIDIRRKLVAADPSNSFWQQDLATALSDQGEWLMGSGQNETAYLVISEALSIRRSLVADDPKNSRKQRELTETLNRLGDASIALGNRDLSLSSFEESLSVTQLLAVADPENVRLQNDLVFTLNRLGDTLLSVGRQAEAISRYRERLTVCEQLAKNQPTDPLKQCEVAICHSLLGEAQIQAENFPSAIEQFQSGIHVFETVIAAGQLEQRCQDGIAELTARIQFVQRSVLAVGPWESLQGDEIADLLLIRAQYFSRRRDLNELIRITERLSLLEPVTVASTYNSACVFCLCAELCAKGKVEPSKSDMSEQKRYLDLALARLNQAISLGFSDFESMRKSDQLAPLRVLPEFKHLLSRTPPKDNS